MPDTDPTKNFLESLPEVTEQDTFCFACHPKVPCFNACCSNLYLMLTPYDVLRLRQNLNKTSNDFIRHYVDVKQAPETNFPQLFLRMSDDMQKSCPFVAASGCTVYEDRPGACRTYPLGRATRVVEKDNEQERFFLVQEEHCAGFQPAPGNILCIWTPKSWLADQEVEAYNSHNDKLMQLMNKIKSAEKKLSAGQANMAALALFQLDNFAQFMADSALLSRLDITDEYKTTILADEETRLDFAIKWMELVVLGTSEELIPL